MTTSVQTVEVLSERILSKIVRHSLWELTDAFIYLYFSALKT